MFEEAFMKRKPNIMKLTEFGFNKIGDKYEYICKIMNGDFVLRVIFDNVWNVDTTLTESDSGEEYLLYKTLAEGVFVGEVREAILDVLEDIAETCFDKSIFRLEQTVNIISYADKTYGDKPEFLWEPDDDAIIRRKDSRKWYVVIMTIPKRKLKIESDKLVEVMNLHAEPEQVEALLQVKGFYPAWHMNKKSWYTVILDKSIEDTVLFKLIDESYRLAGRK